MDTEAKLKAEANKSESQHRMCSWGYKFEQFILDDLRKGGLISEGILIPVRSSIRLTKWLFTNLTIYASNRVPNSSLNFLSREMRNHFFYSLRFCFFSWLRNNNLPRGSSNFHKIHKIPNFFWNNLSKFFRPQFEFSLKVIASNPGYLLKSTLL